MDNKPIIRNFLHNLFTNSKLYVLYDGSAYVLCVKVPVGQGGHGQCQVHVGHQVPQLLGVQYNLDRLADKGCTGELGHSVKLSKVRMLSNNWPKFALFV